MIPFALDDGRVHLSTPTLDDVDEITAACQEPGIAEWTVMPDPYTRRDAERFVADEVVPGWERGSTLTWTVRASGGPPFVAGRGPLLGMMGLGLDDGAPGARSGEIGYWLATSARGRGIGTAAARLVVDWALDVEGASLSRVVWQAYVGNWPSRRLAWRLGFRVEGTVRRQLVQRGVRRDAWIGTVLPDDPREPVEPWPDDAEAAVRGR